MRDCALCFSLSYVLFATTSRKRRSDVSALESSAGETWLSWSSSTSMNLSELEMACTAAEPLLGPLPNRKSIVRSSFSCTALSWFRSMSKKEVARHRSVRADADGGQQRVQGLRARDHAAGRESVEGRGGLRGAGE